MHIHIFVYVFVYDDVYPRETPPHIRTARASPQRHTAAGTAAPTTADTENTVPQPTARQPHSNGLCSPPKEGPGPGSSA